MITFYISPLPPNYGCIAYGPVVFILEKYRSALFAKFIAERYGLTVSYDKVLTLLKSN